MRQGFGKRVEELRLALGYRSKAGLARALGVQPQTVAAWEDAATAAALRDSSVRLLTALTASPDPVERWLRDGGPKPTLSPRSAGGGSGGSGVVTDSAGHPGTGGIPRPVVRQAVALAWDEVADYIVPGGTVPAERVVQVFAVLQAELRLRPPRGDGGEGQAPGAAVGG